MKQSNLNSQENYYQLLELNPSASVEEVREAYERKLEEVHEESLASYSLCPDDANEKWLMHLSIAYMKLADPKTREIYDQEYKTDRSSPQSKPAASKLPERSIQTRKNISWSSDEDSKVVFIQSQNKPDDSPQISREESSNESARMHKDAFRIIAEKNEKARQKIEDYFLSFKANDRTMYFNGTVLNQVRKLKNITLSELAEVTRIRQTYLNAIEEENFKIFPSEVYLRGYLYCYIRTIELPQDKVIQDYMQLYENWIQR